MGGSSVGITGVVFVVVVEPRKTTASTRQIRKL